MNISFSKIGIFVCMTYFMIACANVSNYMNTDQPYMTVSHPGKYSLEYFNSPIDFPQYSRAKVDGREILATGDVVIPSAQSLYMLTHFEVFEGETVLDIGTGSGVQAIFAADTACKVVATDIDALAVDVAKLNVERHGLENKIEVRQGDLFAPLGKDEKFDVILFNIDYPYNLDSGGLWKLHERFFAEVKNYLNPGGRLYYQSGHITNVQKVNDMVINNDMRIISMRMDAALKVDRYPIVYLIQRNVDLQNDL